MYVTVQKMLCRLVHACVQERESESLCVCVCVCVFGEGGGEKGERGIASRRTLTEF